MTRAIEFFCFSWLVSNSSVLTFQNFVHFAILVIWFFETFCHFGYIDIFSLRRTTQVLACRCWFPKMFLKISIAKGKTKWKQKTTRKNSNLLQNAINWQLYLLFCTYNKNKHIKILVGNFL